MQRLEDEMAQHGRSTLEIVRSVASDTEHLIRKEVELAKHEITEGVEARIRRFGALGAAGLLGIIALEFAALAAADGLRAAGMTPWGARLVLAGSFVFLALCAVMISKARGKTPPLAPQQAREQMKETLRGEVQWVKAQLKR